MDFILREIANNTLDTGFNDQLLEAADYINSLEQRLAAANERIAELEAAHRWIPVTERLPKWGATVLAIDNSGDMGVCNFVNARFVGECFGFEAYLNDGGWDRSPSKVIGEYVTNWMPLLEPPESGRGGVMCEQNNDCEYDGNMVQAVGPKDVYLSCVEIDKEIRIPHRLSVIVCPKCGEPDWRTLC